MIFIVNIYHTTEDASGLRRTTTQHSTRRGAWSRVCAVRETGIVSTDPTCDQREWVARIEVIETHRHTIVWSEGELPSVSAEDNEAYFASIDEQVACLLDEYLEAVEPLAVECPTPQQHRQQQQGAGEEPRTIQRVRSLNAEPNAPGPAAARSAGEVIPVEVLEAKRAEVEARREVLDDEVDPAEALRAVGVVELTRSLWHVASDKDADKGYLVTVRAGVATACDCPARQYRRGACKHMRLLGLVPAALDGVAALLERGHTVEEVARDLRRYADRDGRESALRRVGNVATRKEMSR
jgi:hypothetical protein